MLQKQFLVDFEGKIAIIKKNWITWKGLCQTFLMPFSGWIIYSFQALLKRYWWKTAKIKFCKATRSYQASIRAQLATLGFARNYPGLRCLWPWTFREQFENWGYKHLRWSEDWIWLKRSQRPQLFSISKKSMSKSCISELYEARHGRREGRGQGGLCPP